MAGEIVKDSRLNVITKEVRTLNKAYKWELLALLWLAFFLNQADRQIFNVVLPLIRADLQLTDTQMGLVATIFIVTLAVCVPFAGWLGDVFNRKWITTLTVIFWSLATMLTGLATIPLHLILFRSIATGGGEAFFAPANYALISQYHEKTRSLALSIHQTSLYAGVVLSGFLAAYIGELWGWRSAFFVFGGAGVILGIIMIFRIRTPIQVRSLKQDVSILGTAGMLFRKPTFVCLTIAFSAMVFVNVGYLTWMPTFLFENFNMSLQKAGFTSMFFMHAFAFVGVVFGGRVSDKLVPRRKGIRLEIQTIGMIFGVPFILLMGLGNSPTLVYIGLAGFGLFRGLYDSNIYASLYDVVAPGYRASASGIMIMFAFIVGSTSPLLLGILKPTLGLSTGIALLSIMAVVSAVALFVAMKYHFKNDYYNEVTQS